jgi:hypothetical protein
VSDPLRTCPRCLLPVSAGVCDTPPLVFHDREADCIAALMAERDAARAYVEQLARASEGIHRLNADARRYHDGLGALRGLVAEMAIALSDASGWLSQERWSAIRAKALLARPDVRACIGAKEGK